MVDVKSIAPDAMQKDEATDKQHLWRILAYGNPGTGKTHCGFSMGEVDGFGPVLCIDTEGKAHSITHKFDGRIILWEVSNYDEATDALSQALDVAQKFNQEQESVPVLMVDSMSHLWDWSQQKYLEMAYPGRSEQEVNLSSALQGGDSDWQSIKRLHNDRFRKKMLESPYHCYWTATSREDYGAILSGQNDPPAKPEGEKNNVFKATEVLHFWENGEGIPTANLKKNALTKWKFGQLVWPTFSQMREIIQSVVDAEESDEDVTFGELKRQFPQDVDLFEGDPDLVYRGEE